MVTNLNKILLVAFLPEPTSTAEFRRKERLGHVSRRDGCKQSAQRYRVLFIGICRHSDTAV